MNNIVILGAGPCGLSAAWELSSHGYKVTVIEKEPYVGGLCHTVEHKGFRFDLGGHRFISPNTELIRRIEKLLEGDLLTAERKSIVLLSGKSYRYPLSFKDILVNMNPFVFMRGLADYATISLFASLKHKNEASFEDWTINRFGRTFYEKFFKTYTQKMWGIPAKDLSSDWADQRIPTKKIIDLIHGLKTKRKMHHDDYARKFYYPKNGIGQIFTCMAEEIKRNGGIIHLNSKATGVDTENNGVNGVTFQKEDLSRSVECDYLISTIPLPELTTAIETNIPDAQHITAPLRFRGVRFMNILVNKEKISDNTWMYVPENDYIMTRIQEPKRRSPFNAPDKKTSIMLEIPCNLNDTVWNMPDEDMFQRSISDLARLGIDIKDKAMDYFSTKTEHGYPVYRLGYKRHLKYLLQRVNRYENLMTIGRQGRFRYIFMDQAMQMGISAARNIVTDNHNMSFAENIGMEKELTEAKAMSLV